MSGRRLAFDYGAARIGVASTDAAGILVVPLPAIEFKGHLEEISELIAELNPTCIYVGLPTHLSGKESESTAAARKFAASLEVFDLPIKLIDERLTTRSAQRTLKESGYSARESKKLVDSVAAVAILEQGMAMER